MENNTKLKKIIFTNLDREIAVTGKIISEDDFFIVLINKFGKEFRIGKKSIVVIKDWKGGDYGR